MKEAKEFTINRKTWLRGEGSLVSRLLRECDGKMCCLGFYLQACEVKQENMLEVEDPLSLYNLSSPRPALPEWLFYEPDPFGCSSSKTAEALISSNDKEYHCGDMTISQEEFEKQREREVIELFASQGIKVIFIDEEATT